MSVLQAQVEHGGAVLGFVSGVPRTIPPYGEAQHSGVSTELLAVRDARQVHGDGGFGGLHLRLQLLQQ